MHLCLCMETLDMWEKALPLYVYHLCRGWHLSLAVSCSSLTFHPHLLNPLDMSDLVASLEVEAQVHLIPAMSEPRSCGVTEGPQAWLLRKKSRVLLASLYKAQDPWGPSGLPSARIQALHRVEYRLKYRVSQAIRRLKALQAMLALSSHSQTLGWNSSKRLQTLEGFLEEEGTALGLLLPELHSDLCCLESQLAGGLPCSSPRCEEVASALWAGRLPPPWRHHMSAGPQPPWLWLHQLWRQGQLLTRYLSLCGQLSMGGFDQQNRSFHLSAFRHPRGLLLAIRWEASQNWLYSYTTTSPLSSSVIPSPSHQPPTCPASVPGAHPRFQLRPDFIAPSRNPTPKLDHSPSGGPSPQRGPRSSLGPSPHDGSVQSHSFYSRLGLSHGFSADISSRLNVGHSPSSTFNFGPNLNTGIGRQGIEAIRLQFQVGTLVPYPCSFSFWAYV
ncbi:dynein heavy chain domain-containing protein 1-like [Petaurus breviceps papuanus]|uniref:dynein heavy chain domain-containing protein 1-like n=1 Tax=Petaurus breviceps papuanus TaxID=3040969 RepID=UPI0036D82CEF